MKEFESESECSDNESEDGDLEHRAVRKILHDNNDYGEVNDEDDEDWVKKMKVVVKKKKQSKANVSSKFCSSLFFAGLQFFANFGASHVKQC